MSLRHKPHISALLVFVNSLISIGIVALLAWGSHNPLLFPSLGPTVFLQFYSPLLKTASPKNTILGHLIGVICGYLALVLFGLTDAPAVMITGISLARVGAAALSLAATSSFMIAFDVPHPPAGATTLIVSLGIMTESFDLFILMIAVIILSYQSWIINHLTGIPFPMWSEPKE